MAAAPLKQKLNMFTPSVVVCATLIGHSASVCERVVKDEDLFASVMTGPTV